MPGKDGTGPKGTNGRCGCRGAGFRLRDGTGCGRIAHCQGDGKEALKFRREILQNRIKDIDRLIGED